MQEQKLMEFQLLLLTVLFSCIGQATENWEICSACQVYNINAGLSFLTRRQGDCVCPGQEVVFECTTSGGAATVWQGSIFNCQRMSNSILLRHSQFSNSEAVVGVCNDGAIRAHGISSYGNNHTSQLNITINESMLGQIIQCAHDDGRHVIVVGEKILMTDQESLNLSDYVHLSDVRQNLITFNWGPVANTCPFLQYHIETNCGTCPENTTSDTTITCSRITPSIDGTTNDCSFAVHASVLCGTNRTVIGREYSISLRLRVPGTPVVQVIPYYFYSNQELIFIYTTFNKTEGVMITDNIDGSATTYTVNHRDIVTNKICSSVTIPTSLCEETTKSCSHMFELSTSSCPPFTVINVTVFATNVLGNGPTSIPRIIGASNSQVNVTVNLALSTVFCEFLNLQDTKAKSCVIEYGPSRSCGTLPHKRHSNISTIISDSTITIDLPEHYKETMYCFVITASSRTFTLKVKGNFKTACDPSGLSDGTSPPDGVKCGAPLLTLGIRDGIVCYRSYEIGSVASYSCLKCGFKYLEGSRTRTCLPGGYWNGSIPQCHCEHDFNFSSTVFVSALIFITLVTTIIITILIVMLTRVKGNNKKILEQLSQAKGDAVYEEIVCKTPPGSPSVDIDKNVAYDQAMKTTVMT